MAPLASHYPGCSIRARARKDTTVSTANDAHLVKVVRARTPARVSRPELHFAADAQPDTTATLVTKATPVSWQQVRSAAMVAHAETLPVFAIRATVHQVTTG